MAEELKGNVFELRRALSLSAKHLPPSLFPKRRHVLESAAHAARLVSHCVEGLLDARVDDPCEAHGTGLERGVKNQPFHPPRILLLPVLEPMASDLVFIAIQEIHLCVQVTAEVRIILAVVAGFNNFTRAFAYEARADAAVSFVSSFDSLPKGHEDVGVIRIARIKDVGCDALLKVLDAGKWKGHLLGKGS
jgi:hypothetical protein